MEQASTSAPPAPQQRQRRGPNWLKLSPIAWAPIMYTSRFWLKGRVQPKTQHTIFFCMTLVGLFHAGAVMSSDNTMATGRR